MEIVGSDPRLERERNPVGSLLFLLRPCSYAIRRVSCMDRWMTRLILGELQWASSCVSQTWGLSLLLVMVLIFQKYWPSWPYLGSWRVDYILPLIWAVAARLSVLWSRLWYLLGSWCAVSCILSLAGSWVVECWHRRPFLLYCWDTTEALHVPHELVHECKRTSNARFVCHSHGCPSFPISNRSALHIFHIQTMPALRLVSFMSLHHFKRHVHCNRW